MSSVTISTVFTDACYKQDTPEVMDMTTDMNENQNQSRVVFSGSSSNAMDAGVELNEGTTKLSIRASITPSVEMVVKRASLATYIKLLSWGTNQ